MPAAVPLEPSPGPPSDSEIQSPYIPPRRRLSGYASSNMDVDDRDPGRGGAPYIPHPQRPVVVVDSGYGHPRIPAVPRAPSSDGSVSPPPHQSGSSYHAPRQSSHQHSPHSPLQQHQGRHTPVAVQSPAHLQSSSQQQQQQQQPRASLVSPIFSNQPPVTSRNTKQPWNQPPLADWNPYSPHATNPPPVAGLVGPPSITTPHSGSQASGPRSGGILEPSPSPQEQSPPSPQSVNPTRGRPPKHFAAAAVTSPPRATSSSAHPPSAPSAIPPPIAHDVGTEPFSSFPSSAPPPPAASTGPSPSSSRRKRKSAPALPSGPEGSGLLVPIDAEASATAATVSPTTKPAARSPSSSRNRKRNNGASVPAHPEPGPESNPYPDQRRYSRSPVPPQQQHHVGSNVNNNTTTLPPISSIQQSFPPPPLHRHQHSGPPPIPTASRPPVPTAGSSHHASHLPPHSPASAAREPHEQLEYRHQNPYYAPSDVRQGSVRDEYPYDRLDGPPTLPPLSSAIRHPPSPSQSTRGAGPRLSPAVTHSRRGSSTNDTSLPPPPSHHYQPPTYHHVRRPSSSPPSDSGPSRNIDDGPEPRAPSRQNGGNSARTGQEAPNADHHQGYRRGGTSDLEDNQEVWAPELGSYVLQERRKAKEVEKWYERKVADRNEDTARTVGAEYNERLNRITERELEEERERARRRQLEMHIRSQQQPHPNSHYGPRYHPDDGYRSSHRSGHYYDPGAEYPHQSRHSPYGSSVEDGTGYGPLDRRPHHHHSGSGTHRRPSSTYAHDSYDVDNDAAARELEEAADVAPSSTGHHHRPHHDQRQPHPDYDSHHQQGGHYQHRHPLGPDTHLPPPPRLGTKRSRLDSTDSFYRNDDDEDNSHGVQGGDSGSARPMSDAAADLEMEVGGTSTSSHEEKRKKKRRVVGAEGGDEDDGKSDQASGFDAAEELEREVLQGGENGTVARQGEPSVEDELASAAGLHSPNVSHNKSPSKRSNGVRNGNANGDNGGHHNPGEYSDYDEHVSRQSYGQHQPGHPHHPHSRHHSPGYRDYRHRESDIRNENGHHYNRYYHPDTKHLPYSNLETDSLGTSGYTPPHPTQQHTSISKVHKRPSTKRKGAPTLDDTVDPLSGSARSTPIPFSGAGTPGGTVKRQRSRVSRGGAQVGREHSHHQPLHLQVDDNRPSSSGSAAPSIAGGSQVQAPVYEWIGRGDPGYDFRPPTLADPLALPVMKLYSSSSAPPVYTPGVAPSDKLTMARRLHDLESAQLRVWLQIVREDVPKVYKIQTQGYIAKLSQHRRVSSTAAGLKGALRPTKRNDAVFRAKRITKDVANYWRRADKEELENRKRLEREAFQQNKAQEENREAERQARKLEFLITQTELYSHFVGKKDKAAEGAGDESDDDDDSNDLPDFDEADADTIRRHAATKARKAANRARKYQEEFAALTGVESDLATPAEAPAPQTGAEKEAAVEKEVADLVASRMAEANKSQAPVDLDSDELNFQNPTSMTGEMTVAQPQMLMCTLKDYQLKGLNWLANLYEKGINGILADEMGLGKTVQSIAMLTHLAEHHNIWGPFLVVAPASTLHNWHQELTRFVPELNAIPYWGSVKDRQTLRKYWANDRNQIWTKDSDCHVVVTSYTMITQDDKYFQSVNWQFLILDEAQAIKNSTSARWKTLLSLKTRNRLLLTGTPIQNRMQELWALLHFIMPSLFDSHDEFSEWFSRDIENQAEGKANGGLTEHQLRRLHLILKPFMLRRVKRMVQSELSEKIEIDIFCDLSPKQRMLYRRLRSNISIAELLTKAQHMGEADSVQKLMNLIMQFRKVCNHPELFERTDIIAPYAFCKFGRSIADFLREGDLLSCPDSWRNHIELSIPMLMWREGGILDIPGERTRIGFDNHCLRNMMSIWSTDWIEKSARESNSSFSFLSLLNISSSEAHQLFNARPIRRSLDAMQRERELFITSPMLYDSDYAASGSAPMVAVHTRRISPLFNQANSLPRLHEISHSFWTTSYLSRRDARCFVAPVVATPISLYCSDRSFVEHQNRQMQGYLESLALYGLPPSHLDDLESFEAVQSLDLLPGLPTAQGLIGASPAYQLPNAPMQVPDANRLIFDSAKLARLDSLLQELKAGGHRVLIYFQMTKMIDLMEEYLVYRQYKYLRLDGSSKIEDRRDMVTDWQTRPDIFIFLLSTHAGGLGINLTAADTVIFFENDWNPSNDSQAMDRAHRIGQTKQVTVYRLITRGTIDERIVQLARVKKDVSDIVVGNKGFTEIAKPTEIVSLLLDDEELKNLDRGAIDSHAQRGSPGAAASGLKWSNDDGDDFFGGGRPNAVNEDEEDFAGGQPAPPVATTKPKGKGRASTRGKRKSAAASQRESVA